MKQASKTGAVLSVLFFVGVAHAEEKPAFSEVDGNGDGKVSVEQAVKAGIPEAEAKKEDIDDDGMLTKKDWEYAELNPEPSNKKGPGLDGGN
ncbi:MAG TPA: hypothetical protein VJ985_02870 [Gammaproteobacteria bacterium]|nr:hypothetical protein [Gammaproteobacteria bacterium]